MTPDVLALVQDTIRRHAMLAGGETVLAAFSGGADSTALLYLLSRLAPAWGLRLYGLHVDHGLREGSGREADVARRLGQRLGVPVDVVRVAVSRRGSLEEAARTARYAALQAHADHLGAQRIAVGHTADDQAETVVMRLLDGAGVRGLAAIPPVRGRIIRPLIAVRRAALVALLEEASLGWMEDPSNADPKFVRNRIRHELLPMLAAVHDGDLIAGLTRVAGRAREVVDALERMGTLELDRLVRQHEDALTLPREPLAALPRPVATEVLRQAMARLGSRAPLRAWAHRRLARALGGPPPRRPVRVGGVVIEVSGPLVRIGRATPPSLPGRPVPVPGTVALPEVGLCLEARLVPATGYRVPREPGRVAFDAERLTSPLVVRSRERGDRFLPFGADRERRLKTLLIDAKVPRWERDRLPLVEAAGRIVWVGGLRRGAQAPITADSRQVLELRLRPLEET
ncbi:MAG TPA: tRNA lysidine(34) synthetase TilS [Methylomirabilota bacterium]|nr:tRNA lysidine(34) synthetase TilS [Methylomirabilota bacterium]